MSEAITECVTKLTELRDPVGDITINAAEVARAAVKGEDIVDSLLKSSQALAAEDASSVDKPAQIGVNVGRDVLRASS